MNRRKQFFGRASLVILGGIGLMWLPLWNGYPLINSDTGTYLWSAAELFVPVDRPVGYPLFIRVVSLAPSTWAIVLAQAFGTSFLLFRNAELLLPQTRRRELWAFGVVLVTTALTPVSQFVGWLIPDLFAGWLFLGALWFWQAPARHERAAAIVFIETSLLVHNSHLWIALGVLAGLALVLLFSRRKEYVRTFGWLGLIVLAGVALNLGINAWLGAGWTLGRGGSTFVVNRLLETGILSRTLETYCASENWTLCADRATLDAHRAEPGWFLWDTSSPLARTGWQGSAAEHGAIVRRSLECCWNDFLRTGARDGWRQFWSVGTAGDLRPIPEESEAMRALRELYAREGDKFRASLQQQAIAPSPNLLPVNESALENFWLGAAAVLVLVAAIQRDARWLLVWFALGVLLVVNTLVLGAVGGVFARYQARMFWLVPYLVIIHLFALFLERRNPRQEARTRRDDE